MIGLPNFLLACCFPFVTMLHSFFFYLDFLSQAFTIHRTANEGEDYFFKRSLQLPTTSQTLNISWVITTGSPPLHIANTPARTENLCFPSLSH